MKCTHEESQDLGTPENPVIWCDNCGAVQEYDPSRGWAVPPLVKELRKALAEVLDSHGALGGASHELMDHGFTAERAKEICALVDDYYKED